MPQADVHPTPRARQARAFLLPYDSARREERMGRGPAHLLRHGAVSALRAGGLDVDAEMVEADDPFSTEVATTFALYRRLAERVRVAAGEARTPLVLSGNCGAALGAVAGLRAAATGGARDAGAIADTLGVVWFDAHGDFNTPDTTASGFLDGMMLAALTGRCWRGMTARLPGFEPLPPADVVLVGARDLDDAERLALDASEVTLVPPARVRELGVVGALAPALDALAGRTRAVYLHVDVDVLDAAVAKGNALASAGGLAPAELVAAVRLIRDRCGVAGVGVASYDPEYDERGEVYRAAVAALEAAVGG